MIDPYKNDHQSQQVGQLIIENQTDKVTIYGDIDIERSEQGLTQAKQLHQLMSAIVAALEQAQAENKLLDDTQRLQIEHQAASEKGTIDNPFA
ncbi:hypothetical protein [Psychrobacter sp. I-STPA10]|uniref:hypothetical protein n=1 Tax=Psychrobacter sp. I-STPA10 TaxID=2585769 RepID=UPI001E3F254A|nr:hypothetical protein [Psychrobacter sp. I-STPA10]